MRHVSPLVATLLAGLVAAPAGHAAAERPTPPRAVASTLTGTRLAITWTPAKVGRVEVRLRTKRAGKAPLTFVRSAAARKGRLTLELVDREGDGPAVGHVKVQARRCAGSGKAKRCSAYGAWKRPRAATVPGVVDGPQAPGVTGPGAATPLPAPAATGPVPQIGGCPVFPAGHAFNQDVSGLPVDPRSDAYLASIGTGGRVHPDFGAADLGQGPGGFGIPYRVVPASQPFVKTTFGDYAEESDYTGGAAPGSGYPIPLDTPVEGGPGSEGDRHVLVVRQGECTLYELGNAYPRGGGWEASGGAIWDLATGRRPATAQPGWTSADAAGLPILPGLVRYDEVAAGVINHAVRFTVAQTQRAYVAPASHWASSSTDPSRPPMGLRLRMRADFDTSTFKGQSLVVVTALKRYGMIVADNGSNWYISGAADPRWNDDDLNQLKAIPGSAFEVVRTGELVTR